jgi:hypothetical protein
MRFLFLFCVLIVIVGLVLFVLGCFDYSGTSLKSGFLPNYAGFILLGAGAIASMIAGLSLSVIFDATINFNVLLFVVTLLCVGSFGFVVFKESDKIGDTKTFVLLPIVFYLFTVIPAFCILLSAA